MRKLKLHELNRHSIESYRSVHKIPVVIVLENIRSALNTGSIFRTADAFLIEKIFLCGFTAQPPNNEIHKTALGATDSVEWIYTKETETVISKLKKDGYVIISVEQTENSVKLQDLEIEKDKKYALVFGNEVHGVSEAAIGMSDICLEVPQYGTKHSLNIAVCAGIVIWDVFQKISFAIR